MCVELYVDRSIEQLAHSSNHPFCWSRRAFKTMKTMARIKLENTTPPNQWEKKPFNALHGLTCPHCTTSCRCCHRSAHPAAGSLHRTGCHGIHIRRCARAQRRTGPQRCWCRSFQRYSTYMDENGTWRFISLDEIKDGYVCTNSLPHTLSVSSQTNNENLTNKICVFVCEICTRYPTLIQ